MKRLLPFLLLTATCALAGDFSGPLGLQLYSLRETFKTDPVAALDKVKALGFTSAELYSSLPVAPEKLKPMLAERGITVVSGHFSYDAMKKDVERGGEGGADAGSEICRRRRGFRTRSGILGQRMCSARQRISTPSAKPSRRRASSFSTTCMATNSAQSRKARSETFFDQLAAATKPELVAFEMDVFWVVQPGADPVKLLEKYPDRWQLMHLKDIRKGARTGVFTGQGPAHRRCRARARGWSIGRRYCARRRRRA